MVFNARNIDRGPLRHLDKYILKNDERHNLAAIVGQTHQSYKWLENKDIDIVLPHDLWKNPIITNKQITSLIKFRMGQYMGHS